MSEHLTDVKEVPCSCGRGIAWSSRYHKSFCPRSDPNVYKDQVPSKEQVSLAEFIELMREPVHLQDWMRQYIIDALTDTERLRTALSGISTCSTCEACRGAARLALGGDMPNPWQPIGTAPKDRDVFFWIVPNEGFRDTSGNAVTSSSPPRMFYGRYGRWSSLMKATLWHEGPTPPPGDVPPPPPEPPAKRRIDEYAPGFGPKRETR